MYRFQGEGVCIYDSSVSILAQVNMAEPDDSDGIIGLETTFLEQSQGSSGELVVAARQPPAPRRQRAGAPLVTSGFFGAVIFLALALSASHLFVVSLEAGHFVGDDACTFIGLAQWRWHFDLDFASGGGNPNYRRLG